MLETEITQAGTRYRFLLQLLYQCNQLVDKALQDDRRWFIFAPKVCTKFLNQGFILEMLFGQKELELSGEPVKLFEDLSAIYSTLRMQFETHALFYHLFMPSDDIEENILRFRLWELDGLRGRIIINENRTPILNSVLQADRAYLTTVEETINNLPFFKHLTAKQQIFLLKGAVWRFTKDSLQEKHMKNISYEKLMSMTGFNPALITDLYSHLSMHTHPSYVGVLQSFSLTATEQTIGKYSALMLSGMVTAMMIEDISKLFEQANNRVKALTDQERAVLFSMISAARGQNVELE
jgi:hypothetical protein